VPAGRTAAPDPGVMPVDRAAWAQQLDLSNFLNCYYEYRDLQRCAGVRSVLIVGPGQGLDREVLRWRGYGVTTFDIDEIFKPDVVGSVHRMRAFRDQRFDAVIASHVLEHLAEPHLDGALREIARVGRYAFVYLPMAGRHVQLRLAPGFKDLDLSVVLDVFNYFRRPDGVTPRYAQGQHFWEIGMPGFRVRDIRRRLGRFFDVVAAYRNRDWPPSQSFVLKSRTS
jgi:hypothetical protein